MVERLFSPLIRGAGGGLTSLKGEGDPEVSGGGVITRAGDFCFIRIPINHARSRASFCPLQYQSDQIRQTEQKKINQDGGDILASYFKK